MSKEVEIHNHAQTAITNAHVVLSAARDLQRDPRNTDTVLMLEEATLNVAEAVQKIRVAASFEIDAV